VVERGWLLWGLLALGLPGGSPLLPAQTAIRFLDGKALVREIRAKAAAAGGCLVNFWATWCGPCVAELPEVLHTAKTLADHRIPVVTISYELMLPKTTRKEALSKIRRTAAAVSLKLPILVLDDEDTRILDEAWNLPGPIPVTLALGPEGKVRGRIEGRGEREDFDRLARILRKLKASRPSGKKAPPSDPAAFCLEMLEVYTAGRFERLPEYFAEGARVAVHVPATGRTTIVPFKTFLEQARGFRAKVKSFRERPAGTPTVLRTKGLASVSFPFEAESSKKGAVRRSHGVNSFHLCLVEGRWKILSLSWTHEEGPGPGAKPGMSRR